MLIVDESFSGQGIGRSLLEKLIEVSGDFGFWTLQSIIIKENIASIALHRKCGFREVGFREKISQINGVWHDTVLMEHRSKKF